MRTKRRSVSNRATNGKECTRPSRVVSSSFQQEQTRNWFEAKSRGEGAARSESRTRTVPPRISPLSWPRNVSSHVSCAPRARDTMSRYYYSVAFAVPVISRRLIVATFAGTLAGSNARESRQIAGQSAPPSSLSFFFGNFLNVPRPVFLSLFRDSFLDRTFLSSSRSVDLFFFFPSSIK